MLAPVLYAASVAGLALVLVPSVGVVINGSRSWIELPWMSVQPSEFAKVAVIVGMALLIAEKSEADHREEARTIDVAQSLAVAAVPIVLVVLQPDLGTVMVLGSIVFGIIAVAGVPKRWMFGLVAVTIAGTALAIRLDVLKDYQLARFTAFADPSQDPQGIGYNVNQARIAIGNGGVFGQGLLHGSQTQNSFVPEQHTDFIFTVAGEELGLIGAAGIIVLFALVLWRALRIALNAQDVFGRLVAAGIVCWFAFQAFENIGMTLGIMPVTGLPLPFVSYGGSSMFAGLLAVGLLQNIHLGSQQV
jgi:rod shape determining protein RodA